MEQASYKNKISIQHFHRYTNFISQTKPATAELLKASDLQLGQTTDFGQFRFEYARMNLWYGLGLWGAFAFNAHQGFLDMLTVGSELISQAHSKIGSGILAGINYKIFLSRRFYLLPALGGGHIFNYTIDIDLPQSNIQQDDRRCHETCITGSAQTVVYSLSVGVQITQRIAFEYGLEHQLYFTKQKQQLTDGQTIIVTEAKSKLTDIFMAIFTFSFRFGKI